MLRHEYNEHGFPVDIERPPIPEPIFGRRFFIGLPLVVGLAVLEAEFINSHSETAVDDSQPTPVDP